MARGVEQTGGGQNELTARRLDLMVQGLEGLPTFPSVVARLVWLTTGAGGREDKPVGDELGTLISSDVSLTATLLSLANRQYGSAETVAQAIDRIPAGAVHTAMLQTKVFAVREGQEVTDGGLETRAFWRHCLAVACAAGYLAEKTKLADAELAFTCGLLHDIGKLVLCECMPKSYARVVAMTSRHAGNIAEYERRVIGTDHSVAGRRLADQWRLGKAAQDTIWLAHQPIEAIPSSLPHAKVVALVGLADTIAREQKLGFSGNNIFHRSSDRVAGQLGVSPLLVSEVTKLLGDLVEQRYALLALGRGDAEALFREAISSANVELGRLNDEARGRLAQISSQARAFEHLREFFASLSGDATVSEVLLCIARTMAEARGHAPAAKRPVIAYSAGGEEKAMFAVRCEGAARPAWATFKYSPAVQPNAAGGQGQAGDAAAVPDLAEVEGLSDWIDVSACVHQPLFCGGRWVGGAVFPRTGDREDTPPPVVEHLADVVALALAMVQERGHAMEVSEDLAGASQALAEAQEALAEARTLGMVGEMAAGAAHELNNPLAVVSGRAQLMRERAASEEDRRTWDLIAEQARRISEIISELMDFASPPAPSPVRVELGALLTEAREAFSCSDHPQAATTRVDIEIGGEGPAVTADRAQLRAVVEELLANGATACGPPATVRITVEPDEDYEAVLLAVRDTGRGMDDQILKRVFTPFFSSQEAGRRRGLGLPRAKRYVENNGGKIWISSTPGEGTTVYVQMRRA